MIRRNQAFLNKLNILLDIALTVAAYILASWLRLDFLDGQENNMAAVSGKTVLLALSYSLVLFLLLSVMGFYNTTRTHRLDWKIRRIILAVTISTLIATALLFTFRLMDFSRGVLIVFYLSTVSLLVAKYALTRLIFNHYRKKGYNLKHVLVIGTGSLAEQYQRDIEAESELGFSIMGFIGNSQRMSDDSRHLGNFDMLDYVLSTSDLSEAVIALDPEDYSKIREVISVCERNGVKYSVIPFYNDIIPSHPVIETIGRSKLINMRSNRLDNVGWNLIKRGFDMIASALALIVLSPLMLLIAIGVKLSSPGPVLFRQKRVGFNRKEFRMLKFRSMKTNEEEETAWTKQTDPRRTRFGALLRKCSLDELPQLFNVLKGDMSLIGPRPELPHFVEQFKETVPFYMVKHQVKPGITGWAQVNGYRGDTSIEKRIELDLWYIENWSVGLDLRILLRTVFGGMINKEATGAVHSSDSGAERGRGAADPDRHAAGTDGSAGRDRDRGLRVGGRRGAKGRRKGTGAADRNRAESV